MNRRTLIRGITSLAVAVPANAGAAVPNLIDVNLVSATRSRWNGRECLAVELTDDEQQGRLNGSRSPNAPTFAIVGRDFSDGAIEVGAELNGKGGEDARGFAGLSFHISDDFQIHETVYLRMTNGRLNAPLPPAPRIDRAIQYVAHPDFHFPVSREKFPGRYEKGADIAAGRWFRLRLEIEGPRLRALVDGAEALVVDDLHYPRRRGLVGLFVDDGTRGFFGELKISS